MYFFTKFYNGFIQHVKRWRWKTLASPSENYIGKKILANASLTSNKTLLAKMIAIIDMFVM